MKLGLIDENGQELHNTAKSERKWCTICNKIIGMFEQQVQIRNKSNFTTYHKDCYEKTDNR